MDELLLSGAGWFGLAVSMWATEQAWSNRTPHNPSRSGSLTDEIMVLATVAVMVAGLLARLMLPVIVIRPAWLAVALGLLVGGGGLALRAVSMRALQGGYVLRLHVSGAYPLVSSGPYRMVRHPGYAGILLQLLGLQLVTGSPIAVAALLLVICLLPIRIRIEESMLSEAWGEEYERYRRSTPYRILPRVF
jgi:protein-S-isoprenylcysteine O-methyltransferase Ste14